MTLLPDQPPDSSRDGGAEATIWQALREELPDDALLLHGLRLQDGPLEREIDVLVVLPGLGLAVIEVKGGRVWLTDGTWYQGAGGGHVIDPGLQASRAMHALRGYLTTHATSLRDVRLTHLVAFPATTLPPGTRTPDLPPAMLIDASDVAAGRVMDAVRSAISRHSVGHEAPTTTQVGRVHEVLAPSFLPQAEALVLAEEHAQQLERLTKEQERVLDLAVALPRVHIAGGAGSGKTWLALQRTRRLTREGKRVALLCYSRGLAWYLQQHTSGWPQREQPAWVGLFHDLPVTWGAVPGNPSDPEDWEARLPADLARLAGQQGPSDLFDAIVVDEAQDFGSAWWPALVRCLRDPVAGGLTVFSDTAQRVFDRDGEAPIDLVPIHLTENLRSTREIAQTFGSLAEGKVTPRGMHGPPVRLVDVAHAADLVGADRDRRTAAAQAVLSAADDAVNALLDEGWDPGHVALVCTGSRHPEQVSTVDRDGWDAYWRSFFAGDDVFYGHVLGFKGLERRVVVLAVNGVRDVERLKHLIYTGMSRAQALLVVVGPRELLHQAGGEAMERRLRTATAWQPVTE